jgi:REP element-mobilizing transposase RayT
MKFSKVLSILKIKHNMKSKKYKNRKHSQGINKCNYEFIKIIFFTKYNRHLLNEPISSRARQLISEILQNLNCRIYNIHIKPNYVFLIIGKPVELETSRLMGRVKSISSLHLRRECPELVERTPKALWAVKYRVLE